MTSARRAPHLVIEFFEDEHWLGGSIYVQNLLATLAAMPPEARPPVRLHLLSSADTPLARSLLQHPVIAAHGAHGPGRLAVAARRLRRGLSRRSPALGRWLDGDDGHLHFPVFDGRHPWRRNLYWIPDFQLHHFPDWFEPAERELRLQGFRAIAAADGVLLLSSQSALDDLHRFYPGARVTPRVWSFCSSVEAGPVADCADVLARHGLPAKFLYVANQFWRHKDHATLFEALRLLRDAGTVVPLVCTGLQHDRRDAAYVPSLMRRLDDQGLRAQVHLLGMVPRQDQVQLFRAAAAVVQPSRFEGWSTVIEDAKALGRPVIASDLAVHREQLAGLEPAWLFAAGDPAALAATIGRVWPGLPAGPDAEGERRAARRRDAWRLEAAHRFAAIVQEAVARPPAHQQKDKTSSCAESQV